MIDVLGFFTQYAAIIIFYAVIIVILIAKRKKLDIQAKFIILYRMKWGLKWMDKYAAKYREWVILLGYLGVGAGFVGMIFISYILVKNLWEIFTVPSASSGVALVLPGVNVPGMGVLPFWYWIIAIFVIAIVHEFSHGIVARAHNLKVKNTGIVFFGPIIGAFVEPDEKQIMKEKDITQYSILAAGAFSNILLAIFAILLLTFVSLPLQQAMIEPTGFTFDSYVDNNLPFENAGIEPGTIIMGVNGQETKTFNSFISEFQFYRPGEKIIIETSKGNQEVTLTNHPDNSKKPYMGIQGFKDESIPKEKFESGIGGYANSSLAWINGFLKWLFLLSLVIGLFNLLPLPIVDGGRMAQVFLHKLKGEDKGNKMYHFVGMFFLFVLVLNLILPWLMNIF
ncbi:site-2 protease family protein [Candidatus Woesearchaeota archaeon]|nr:site-2 protease family protein [Candidatus Woesearchaeota archaeon]